MCEHRFRGPAARRAVRSGSPCQSLREEDQLRRKVEEMFREGGIVFWIPVRRGSGIYRLTRLCVVYL